MDHTLNKINNAIVVSEPFQHMIIDDFLDKDLYNKINNEINKITFFKETDKTSNRSTHMIYNYDYEPTLPDKVIHDYNSILLNGNIQNTLIKKFNLTKKEGDWNCNYKGLLSQIDCFRAIYNYRLHTDHKSKFMTCVLYFAQDDTQQNLGTRIYDSKKNYVTTIDYVPNRCLIFSPCDKSWHNMQGETSLDTRRCSIQSWYVNTYQKYSEIRVGSNTS